jgi:hypothetical protein
LARSDHDRHKRRKPTSTSGEAGGLGCVAEGTHRDAAAFGLSFGNRPEATGCFLELY